MVCTFLLSLPVFCWVTFTDGAIFTEDQAREVGNFINTVIGCHDVPGLAIAVVKGNETWTRGYGVANRDSGRPVTSSTRFVIASQTKAFTAALISLFLNDSAGLTWETRLVDILGPDFRLGDDYITQNVMLKDILTHRTGLSTSILQFDTGFPDTMTLAEFQRRIRYLPIVHPFRDKFHYTNWMYALAGRVAEVMGGASWEELLRTRLLQPMGMQHTTLASAELDTSTGDFASSYRDVDGQETMVDTALYRDLGPQTPAGGIMSSADDMSRWMYVLLNQGRTPDGVTVLDADCISEMQSTTQALFSRSEVVHRPAFPVSDTLTGYGYAWYTMQYRGYSMVGHTGTLYAFKSYLVLLHDFDLGIFITTNGPGDSRASDAYKEIFYHVTDLVLGHTPWLNTSVACQFPAPWVNVTTDSSSSQTPTDAPTNPIVADNGWTDVRPYVGSYGNLLLGELVVREDEGHRLSASFNNLQGRLHRTDQPDIVRMEAIGPHHHVTAGEGQTNFMRLVFLQADSEGRYQRVRVSIPYESDEWLFDRAVRFDSLPGTGSDTLVG